MVPLKVKTGAVAVQVVSVCWAAGLTAAVADTFCAVTAALHDSVYAAGLEAAWTGLLTTRTASPLVGSSGGTIVIGAAAIVPAAAKVRVSGAES